MKSNFLFSRTAYTFSSKKIAIAGMIIFLSAFQVAKADPNIEAAVISITNPSNLCDPGGAGVTVGITPTWVPTTYDDFYITSVKLYALRDKGSGISREELIATAGQQSSFQTTVTLNGVHGEGLLRVEITYYQADFENPGNSGYWTHTTEFTDSPGSLLALAPSVINNFAVLNGQQVGPGSYELLSCSAGSYDLEFDLDHIFGMSSNPTATFEIFDVSDCSDPLVNDVYYLEYNEGDQEDYFIEDFLDEANEAFKDLVENNSGTYTIRLRMDGGAVCGGSDQEETICIRIGEVPEFEDLYLIKNDEQPATPLDTVPAPNNFSSADTIGGLSGGLWAHLSSGDYDYFRFRLEYDPTASGIFTSVGLKSQYSTNNTNVGGTLNVQFNTMISNSTDFLFNNLGVYRIYVIVGVNGCDEDSTAGYFWVTSPWQFKSAEAAGVASPEEYQDKIEVYPLPAHDHLSILNATGKSNLFYWLYDINGRMVRTGNLMEETFLEVSTLPDGAYFLRCATRNGEIVHRQKVIKY